MSQENIFIEVPASNMSLAKRKLVRGVGTNDANYLVYKNGSRCSFYATWINMIDRCYSENFHEKQPTYIGCTVCQEWLTFSNFKKWMEHEDFYGKQLDKDIISPSNKIYSPDNCCFVTSKINILLADSRSSRGEFPIGVSFDKEKCKFESCCNFNGRKKHLGYFDTPEEAHSAYKQFKHTVIIEAANLQTDERIRDGLLRHANLLIEVTQ